MPTATKPPKTESETSEPSMTERLADDATATEVEYPEGAPELLPVLRLPRRRRADYYDAMAAISGAQAAARQDDVTEAATDDDRPMAIRLAAVADGTRILAAIEELLAVVAVDPDGFREWALGAEDAVLVQLFNAYVGKTQPGEASSSAS